jgi:Protein of unknown function (DUF2283)
MKVKYDAEFDILMFVMLDQPPANAIAEPSGVIVSYSDTNEPVSIEFLNAFKRQLFNPAEMNLTIST